MEKSEKNSLKKLMSFYESNDLLFLKSDQKQPVVITDVFFSALHPGMVDTGVDGDTGDSGPSLVALTAAPPPIIPTISAVCYKKSSQ